jgi:hypothetical protein
MPVVKRKLKKLKAGNNGHWREDQKIDAVAKFLILGKLTEVGRDTGIPEDTLRKWKATDWWKETEQALRKESVQQTSGKLGKILDKSLSVVEDRLSHGDYVYDPKSGSIKRIGVKASVANQITKDVIDRKILLEKIAQKDERTDEKILDRLTALKQEFLKFTNSKTIEAKTIEVIQNDS